MSDLPDNVKSDVATAKANGCTVLSVSINKSQYVYRSINRLEYKKLQEDMLNSQKAADEKTIAAVRDDGEEQLVLKALIHPRVASKLDLNGFPAGVISKLAELVMQASGFGDIEEKPVEL